MLLMHGCQAVYSMNEDEEKTINHCDKLNKVIQGKTTGFIETTDLQRLKDSDPANCREELHFLHCDIVRSSGI